MRRMIVMLVVAGSLLATTATTATPAGAWGSTVTTRTEVPSAIAPHPILYTVVLGADWDTKTAAQCGSLYPCFGAVNWRKGTINGIMGFESWLPDQNNSGILTNGVRWKSKKITATFNRCVVPGWSSSFCVRHTTWVKLVIRTNKTYTVTSGTS